MSNDSFPLSTVEIAQTDITPLLALMIPKCKIDPTLDQGKVKMNIYQTNQADRH
jgi:hypothetical protein